MKFKELFNINIEETIIFDLFQSKFRIPETSTWQTLISLKALDEYLYRNMSDQILNKRWDTNYIMNEFYIEADVVDKVRQAYFNSIFKAHEYQLNGLAESMFYDYEPLVNYDRTETQTHNESVNTADHTTTMQIGARSQTDTDSGRDDSVTDKTTAFDSADYGKATNSSASKIGNSTATTSTAAATDTTTEAGYNDTSNGGYTLRAKGNIGVTTSQQMLESERAVREFNFFEKVMEILQAEICVNDWEVCKTDSYSSSPSPKPTPTIEYLSDLKDVVLTALKQDDSLVWNGSMWINKKVEGKSNLSELNDTTISSPANGQYLRYENGKWINEAGGGGGGASTLEELDDVAIVDVQEGDVLVYDGIGWANSDSSKLTTFKGRYFSVFDDNFITENIGNSAVIGTNNNIAGSSCHVIGNYNTADAELVNIIGNGNNARFDGSIIIGQGGRTTRNNQIVIGANRQLDNHDYSVVIGNSNDNSLVVEDATGSVAVKNYLRRLQPDGSTQDYIPFRFGIDGDGNYGYYKADDSFVPFRSGAPVMQVQKVIGRFSDHYFRYQFDFDIKALIIMSATAAVVPNPSSALNTTIAQVVDGELTANGYFPDSGSTTRYIHLTDSRSVEFYSNSNTNWNIKIWAFDDASIVEGMI